MGKGAKGGGGVSWRGGSKKDSLARAIDLSKQRGRKEGKRKNGESG